MSEENKVRRPPVVPKEYGGKYIVWNDEETEIIFSGRTLAEVRQAAIDAGQADPLVQKIPQADRPFVGSPRVSARLDIFQTTCENNSVPPAATH